MKSVKPKKQIIELSKAILNDVWARKNSEMNKDKNEASLKQKQIETQIDDLLLRVTKTSSDSLIQTYEEKIEKLDTEKKDLQKLTLQKDLSVSFETALDTVVTFLESPYFYWSKGGVNEKRLVLKLVFSGKLPYHFENGFETTEVCCVLKVFEQIAISKSQDVDKLGKLSNPLKVFISEWSEFFKYNPPIFSRA